MRLKLSKLQFVLRNRQISEFDLQCRCFEVYLSASDLFDGTQLQVLHETDGCREGEFFCESVRTLTTSMPMCWHLRCSRKFQRRHQEKMRKLTKVFGRSADSCKSMQVDISISVVSQCDAGSIDFFMLTLASMYRVRRTEEVKTP